VEGFHEAVDEVLEIEVVRVTAGSGVADVATGAAAIEETGVADVVAMTRRRVPGCPSPSSGDS